MIGHYLTLLWMPLLEHAVLSGTVLLAFGATLGYLARYNAALRHRIGVFTFIGLLLLPLLSIVPGKDIRLPLTQKFYSSQTPATPAANVMPAADTAGEDAGETRAIVPAEISSEISSIRWTQFAPHLLFLIWMSGVAIVLSRQLLGVASVRRVQSNASTHVQSGPLAELNTELAHSLGLQRPVNLYLARDASVTMPMTWGWRSPILLLPQEASNWSVERLRCVLLHELSHIKRGDWAVQTIATLCCALYWFHPLAWTMFSQLKADAESATDEQVVAKGIKASDYCTHLLELARQASQPARLATYGVPMTRTTGVETRLNNLLDNTRRRRGISQLAAIVLAGSFCMLFIGLSIVKFRVAPTPGLLSIPALRAGNSYTGKLASNSSVSLLGISTHPSLNQLWWTPQGKPLPAKSFLTEGARSGVGPNQVAREFVVAVQNLPKDSSWRWKTHPSLNWASGSARFGTQPPVQTGNPKLLMLAATLPQGLSRFTLELGIADGPWETQFENSAQSSSSTSIDGSQAMFARGIATEDNTTVTVTHTIDDKDVRLVAVDTDGKEHKAQGNESSGNGTFYQVTSTFKSLPLDRVKVFRLQTRPYHWATFPNVVLTPPAQTGN